MKGKLDVDSLWNAVIERMIDFTSNTLHIPLFAMYFGFQILTFGQIAFQRISKSNLPFIHKHLLLLQ
jgi:uncharacterized membrane protein YeiB